MRWLPRGSPLACALLCVLSSLALASPPSSASAPTAPEPAAGSRDDVVYVSVLDAVCPQMANSVRFCMARQTHISALLSEGVVFDSCFASIFHQANATRPFLFGANLSQNVQLLDLSGVTRVEDVRSQAFGLVKQLASRALPHASPLRVHVVLPGSALDAAARMVATWPDLDELVARLMLLMQTRVLVLVAPALPEAWSDQAIASRVPAVLWGSSLKSACKVTQVLSAAQVTSAAAAPDLCVPFPVRPVVVRGPGWDMVAADVLDTPAVVGVACHPEDGYRVVAWRATSDWMQAHVSDGMINAWWEDQVPGSRRIGRCAVPFGEPAAPSPLPGLDAPEPPLSQTVDGAEPSPPADPGSAGTTVPDEAIWAALGGALTLGLLICGCCAWRWCCARPKGFAPLVEGGVELRTVAEDAGAVRAPAAPARPPLAQLLVQVGNAFEANPVVGASSFESLWNQCQIVDVWGHSVHFAPVAPKLVPLLARLHCGVVASGTVSGVEKVYFFARTKKQANLALIEVSVNLATQRLSAVLKSSAVLGGDDMYLLFEGFRRCVEEGL